MNEDNNKEIYIMTNQVKTPKDAKEAINMVAESANKVAEESKIVVDEMVNFTAKAAEDSQAILASNQKLFQNSLEVWQNYTQAYLEFVIKATQRTVEQSFAFRQSLDKIFVDSLKRNQTLLETEQGAAFDAVDAFQTQVKATSDRVAKSFNIPSLN
jgi:hypothetical protein